MSASGSEKSGAGCPGCSTPGGQSVVLSDAWSALSKFSSQVSRHQQTIIAAMRMQLLGGLSGEKFLSKFWQKKPLLVRKAITGFKGVVQAPELLALSLRHDIESRLVCRRRGAWHVQMGPFSRTQLARLPKSGWTLLVQGLNLELPEADALLRRFRFLPYARLDDVMVSYAAAGGGVGPHFDSYDVFLLQGPGRRRWSVGKQRDPELDAKAPLRILANFRPQEEWLLEPGDMLYLPPGGGSEKDGATRRRRCPANSLARSGRRAFPGRVPVGTQAANRVFAAAHSALAREVRRAVPRPGHAPGPAHQDAVPGAGVLRQRRAGRAAGTPAEIPRAPRRRARPAPGRAPPAAPPRAAARLVPRRLASHRRAP